jgi:hypothetical protein
MAARTVYRTVSRAIAAAVLAVVTPLGGSTEPPAPPSTQAGAQAGVDVLGVRRTAGQGIAFVASVSGAAAPATAPTATVTAGGESLPAQVTPLWSDSASFGVVVDVSADGAAALAGGGLSGAGGFLLQLPPGARSGVIAAREPPAVAAAPSVGASDDLRALSTVRSGGARATSEALTLAVSRLPGRPGNPTVIALHTSAADAGGEAAAALGDRLRRANAVLAVVTTAADPRYWTGVARATGGVAVATSPDRAIGAFDEVADALRARYVVSFTRPPAGAPEATVRWAGDGSPAVVSFTLPPEATAPAGVGTPSRRVAGALAAAVLAGLVMLAATGVLVRRRRRRHHEEDGEAEEEDELVPIVPEGVRVFVMESDAPREITDSLFEPRSVRDARERMAREREAREQGRTAEGADRGD